MMKHLHLQHSGVLCICILFIGCNQAQTTILEEPVVVKELNQIVHEQEVVVTSSISSLISSVQEIPRKVLLDVPFSSQAPRANWDDPYQEACEEMSLIMVHSYLQNRELTLEDADGSLLALIAWETKLGYPHDVTLEQLSVIAEQYFNYKTEVSYEVTIESIKQKLSEGKPVIVPAAGRKLGNPYFSGEGPWYHMLVIVGYDGKYFITNDPGTRRGKEYKYKQEVLLDAVHNWIGKKEEIEKGGKVMMTIE